MRPFPTDFPKEFLFISLIVSTAVRLSLALSPGAAIGAVNVYRSVPTLSSSSSPIPSLASETHTTDVFICENFIPLATGEGENRAGELVVAFPDVPSACVDERWELEAHIQLVSEGQPAGKAFAVMLPCERSVGGGIVCSTPLMSIVGSNRLTKDPQLWRVSLLCCVSSGPHLSQPTVLWNGIPLSLQAPVDVEWVRRRLAVSRSASDTVTSSGTSSTTPSPSPTRTKSTTRTVSTTTGASASVTSSVALSSSVSGSVTVSPSLTATPSPPPPSHRTPVVIVALSVTLSITAVIIAACGALLYRVSSKPVQKSIPSVMASRAAIDAAANPIPAHRSQHSAPTNANQPSDSPNHLSVRNGSCFRMPALCCAAPSPLPSSVSVPTLSPPSGHCQCPSCAYAATVPPLQLPSVSHPAVADPCQCPQCVGYHYNRWPMRRHSPRLASRPYHPSRKSLAVSGDGGVMYHNSKRVPTRHSDNATVCSGVPVVDDVKPMRLPISSRKLIRVRLPTSKHRDKQLARRRRRLLMQQFQGPAPSLPLSVRLPSVTSDAVDVDAASVHTSTDSEPSDHASAQSRDDTTVSMQSFDATSPSPVAPPSSPRTRTVRSVKSKLSLRAGTSAVKGEALLLP